MAKWAPQHRMNLQHLCGLEVRVAYRYWNGGGWWQKSLWERTCSDLFALYATQMDRELWQRQVFAVVAMPLSYRVGPFETPPQACKPLFSF